MVCKSVTEMNDHAKNFPNAPRMLFLHSYVNEKYIFTLRLLIILTLSRIPLCARTVPE